MFNAKDYKTASLLLKYGADPLQNQKYDPECPSALEHLLEVNEDSATAILDQCMVLEKNFDLVLEFDIFKDSSSSTEVSLNNSILDKCAKNMNSDSSVLMHPLVEIFFLLKARTVWPLITILTVFYHFAIVPITITLAGMDHDNFFGCKNMTLMKGDLQKCYQTIDPVLLPNQGYQFCQNSSMDYSFPYDDATNTKKFNFTCDKGLIKFNDDSSEMNDWMDTWKWSFLYIWTFGVLCIYIFKEVTEIAIVKLNYFTFIESWCSMALCVTSLTFLLVSLYDYKIANEIAGWMVLIVWIEFFFYLGHFNGFFGLGDFAFMSVYVAKPALLCLLTHSPIFIAFACGFGILLQSDHDYDLNQEGFFGAIVKIVSMMFEPTYEFNFPEEKIAENGGYSYSAKAMALLFMIFVPVVVLNLLIAVSVHIIDIAKLKKKSKLMRTKRKMNTLLKRTFWNKFDFFKQFFKPLEFRVNSLYCTGCPGSIFEMLNCYNSETMYIFLILTLYW